MGPEAVAAWLSPGGMAATIERFDARPGGSYRMALRCSDHLAAPGKATASTDPMEVRFTDLVPGARMVQAVDFVSDDPAHGGTMPVTWELVAVEGGTRVEITAGDVPDAVSAEDHAAGMASFLDKLAEHLEGWPNPPGQVA